jgi:hypothetical protein
MNHSALLGSALQALLRNKMRSLLPIIGITIGIAAVICVVAIGKAGQTRVPVGDVQAIAHQVPLINRVSPNVDGSIQVV